YAPDIRAIEAAYVANGSSDGAQPLSENPALQAARTHVWRYPVIASTTTLQTFTQLTGNAGSASIWEPPGLGDLMSGVDENDDGSKKLLMSAAGCSTIKSDLVVAAICEDEDIPSLAGFTIDGNARFAQHCSHDDVLTYWYQATIRNDWAHECGYMSAY